MHSGPVALASDHGGFALKEALERYLTGKGLRVIDVGTHSTDACDYPVFAKKAADEVASGRATRAVVVDGAGIGSCMVANKVAGVRAGMAFDEATAKNAREHNDANLLTLGAGYLDEAKARAIVDIFLSTECTVDRHKKRVAMIDALDRGRGERSASNESASGGSAPSGPGTAGPRRSLEMNAAAGDKQRLVEQITQVLARSPQLLASLGSSGDECRTCPRCDHQCARSAPDVVRSLVRKKPDGRVSARLGATDIPKDIARFIDHTLLKAEATYDEIEQLCAEARKFEFASVCVNPVHVRRCADALRGSRVLVCTVIGFPLGATPRENKAMETRKAIRDGAKEVDMVINIGALKSGDKEAVYEDIRLVREAAHEGGALLKVIIETALLTDEEKTTACVLAKRARADFVKTSTGFSKGGATAHDVALMARAVEGELGVKASGGVRSAGDAQQMIAAGATRIGASVGVRIVQETRGEAKPGKSAGAGY